MSYSRLAKGYADLSSLTMINRKRVLLLNRFFFPDHSPTSELLSDLAFTLSDRGFHVTVITSRLRYGDLEAKLLPNETLRGVQVWRTWSLRFGRQRLIRRSLDYLSFYLSAGWRLWRLTRPGDVIVAKTDPPLLSIMAAIVARARGARVINWLQDLFPEVAEKLEVGGAIARPFFRQLQVLRNWSLHSAEMNVVPGMGMAEKLEQESIPPERIQVIPNWGNGELIQPISPTLNALRVGWGLASCFVVGYAGNFGRAHDFDTIIEAMTLLERRAKVACTDDAIRKIRFLFVGGGAQGKILRQEIWERQLTNVKMQPYQPRDLLAQTLAAADIHLVSLKPELEGLIVPSKLYSIAAAGRPVLFIGASNGEIARLIEEAQCGMAVASGDSQGLVCRILALAKDPDLVSAMGLRARLAFDEGWDRHHALTKWQAVIDAVICPAPGAKN